MAATARASFAFYNTYAEVDALVAALGQVREMFRWCRTCATCTRVILDHNKRPRNFHALAGANRTADGHNPLCGDRLTVFLDVENGVIRDVSFVGAGCAISKASASMMTDSVKGKTVAEAEQLFEEFHRMVTSGSKTGGQRAGQARGVLRRPGVPGARQVREPGLAHAARGAGRPVVVGRVAHTPRPPQ